MALCIRTVFKQVQRKSETLLAEKTVEIKRAEQAEQRFVTVTQQLRDKSENLAATRLELVAQQNRTARLQKDLRHSTIQIDDLGSTSVD